MTTHSSFLGFPSKLWLVKRVNTICSDISSILQDLHTPGSCFCCTRWSFSLIITLSIYLERHYKGNEIEQPSKQLVSESPFRVTNLFSSNAPWSHETTMKIYFQVWKAATVRWTTKLHPQRKTILQNIQPDHVHSGQRVTL